MILYMAVTQDEYELPLAVADSLRELARLQRTSSSYICKIISGKRGKKSKVKYIKVEVEDD